MRRLVIIAAIILLLVVVCFGRANSVADQYLFTDDAYNRLSAVDSADTLTHIKLLTNLAFYKKYKSYKKYRKRAQEMVNSYQAADSSTLVNAYKWALRVMEIRDWGWWSKLTSDPKGKVRQAYDSISLVLARDVNNETIRFLRVGIAIESANPMPEFFDSIKVDLTNLDFSINRSDIGASFFVELLWAKYYYWVIQKKDPPNKQELLLIAQHHINCASVYAELSFYREEIITWKKRIEKENPENIIWCEQVLLISQTK